MAEDNAYTTDGVYLLDGKPCEHIPVGDCENCDWWEEYVLDTARAEES
jgi:hypothetical protein